MKPEAFYSRQQLQPYRFFDVCNGRHEGAAGGKSLFNQVCIHHRKRVPLVCWPFVLPASQHAITVSCSCACTPISR